MDLPETRKYLPTYNDLRVPGFSAGVVIGGHGGEGFVACLGGFTFKKLVTGFVQDGRHLNVNQQREQFRIGLLTSEGLVGSLVPHGLSL